jgi:hypothetical protein
MDCWSATDPRNRVPRTDGRATSSDEKLVSDPVQIGLCRRRCCCCSRLAVINGIKTLFFTSTRQNKLECFSLETPCSLV